MRKLLIAGLLVAAAASAQEGFPLDGTWRSQGVAADGSHSTIVIIMQWDGRQVSGTINPGPDGVDFTGAQLDPEGWKFQLSAKSAKGVDFRFDGAISELGKYDRVLSGKWTEGGHTTDVRFVRE